MVLDVLVGKFGEQNVHLVIESGVVCRSANDEGVVAEHVADDIRMMGLGYVVHHNILHACL